MKEKPLDEDKVGSPEVTIELDVDACSENEVTSQSEKNINEKEEVVIEMPIEQVSKQKQTIINEIKDKLKNDNNKQTNQQKPEQHNEMKSLKDLNENKDKKEKDKRKEKRYKQFEKCIYCCSLTSVICGFCFCPCWLFNIVCCSKCPFTHTKIFVKLSTIFLTTLLFMIISSFAILSIIFTS